MSSMAEKLINQYVTSLDGKISARYLSIIRDTLTVALDGYDVVPKETALTPFTGVYPESYRIFMVTRKIEGASDKTLGLYKLYLDQFFKTVNKPVKEITSNDVKVYLYQLQGKRGISNRTLDSHRSVLSSYFSWAAAERYIDYNPMATVKPIKYEIRDIEPLSDTELELIREACGDIREKAIVEFFYSTGCRVTEMERLNRADIDFAKGEVMLFGKGNKHRVSYLTAKAAILLKQYLDTRSDDNDALFVSEKEPHRRIHKAGIEKIIKEIGNRAGVERLHPHLIRHTTATNALQHGMDVTQVQKLLGHARLDTTMIYAKVSEDDIKSNHRKYIS